MSTPRAVALFVAAVTVAVLVVGCDSSNPPSPTVVAAAVTPSPTSTPVPQPTRAAPSTPEQTATPSPAPTPTATAAPAPTPTATPTATPTPAPRLVALPKLSKEIPGAAKIRYFSIVGESPEELVAQTVAKSAGPCKSRTHDVLACVSLGGGVHWVNTTNLATGSCTVTSMTTPRNPVVHLPRWTGPQQVRPALVRWWKTVLGHFAWHEGQHIKIQQAYDKKLRPLLVGHKCSSARTIIRRWERTVAAAQDRFDAKDYSWQPETSVLYTGP